MTRAGPAVAVIGAGLSGLALARRLAGGGFSVSVFEAGPRPGGVVGTANKGGFVLERAANGFLGDAPGGALALCRELGVEVAPASPAARRRWIYRGGRLRALPASPREALTTDVLSARGKLRALTEPMRPARGGEETVADFFRRRFGDEVVRAVVAPFVVGVFAGDAEALSLAAAFPRLKALEGPGGLAAGALLGRGRAGQGGRARPGPPRLHAPTRGMGALAEALASAVGGALQTSAPVAALESDGETLSVALADGRRRRFDAAALAVPAPAAARLCAGFAPELAGLLESIPYVPVAAVHLGYRREQVGHPLGGFGFLVAEGEDLRLLGALFESEIFDGRAPEGRVLFRCMLGGARDPAVVALKESELARLARRDLERVLSLRGEPEEVAVTVYPQAIAQYTLGHLERVERAEALAARHRIVLTGAAYRGVSVNDCVAGASSAEEALRATLS